MNVSALSRKGSAAGPFVDGQYQDILPDEQISPMAKPLPPGFWWKGLLLFFLMVVLLRRGACLDSWAKGLCPAGLPSPSPVRPIPPQVLLHRAEGLLEAGPREASMYSRLERI